MIVQDIPHIWQERCKYLYILFVIIQDDWCASSVSHSIPQSGGNLSTLCATCSIQVTKVAVLLLFQSTLNENFELLIFLLICSKFTQYRISLMLCSTLLSIKEGKQLISNIIYTSGDFDHRFRILLINIDDLSKQRWNISDLIGASSAHSVRHAHRRSGRGALAECANQRWSCG